MATIRNRAVDGLINAIKEVNGPGVCDPKGYCQSLSDNLVAGIEVDQFREEFDAGAGQELNQKMRAAHSSSALAVNSFCRHKDNPTNLTICGLSQFDQINFEVPCPTGLKSRTPPHLDLIAISDTATLAIESKCTEYLSSHRAKFSDAYPDQVNDERAETGWYAEMEILRKKPSKYRYLDAAQLIKHYYGLAHAFRNEPVILLYLYWEPVNRSDYKEFADHRAEIVEFSRAVGETNVAFKSQSYLDLWAEWSDLGQPIWLSSHVENLQGRYAVSI